MIDHEHLAQEKAAAYVRGELELGEVAAIADSWRFCSECYRRIEDARKQLKEKTARAG